MYFAVYDSPVGRILLESDGDCLTGLWLDRVCPEEENRVPVIEKTIAWLDGYFRGENAPMDIPLNPKGTAFQKLVWGLLADIPWGTVRTYGDLARDAATLLEKDKMSAQAVGQAVGANPIAILIPCHRCVAAGGKQGGYAYGLRRKQWLLDHERMNCDELCKDP